MISTAVSSIRKSIKKISPKKVKFSAILAVYKSKEGYWKGFAHPYDVTAQATTQEVAIKRLKESVEIYEAELKKFSYPSHLVQQPLSDLEDREMFSRIVDAAIDQKGVIDGTEYHAETYKVRS